VIANKINNLVTCFVVNFLQFPFLSIYVIFVRRIALFDSVDLYTIRNVPTEIFLSRHRGVVRSPLSSHVFNVFPTIFHGTCTAWVAVSGRYSSEKRTWKMSEYRDNAFSRIRASQMDTESRRRISSVSPCETLTENSRATILPAKGYNKYGAIVTITLL